MGIIGDIKAINDVQKIKNGGVAKLSISQITGLIINLMDANKNLSNDEYNRVYKKFCEFRKCKTKIDMDMDGYLKTAVDIIKEFDKIAPYEKYSGGNEIEFGFLMNDIRAEREETNTDILTLIDLLHSDNDDNSDDDDDDDNDGFICDNCGVEFDEDIEECPNCGCTFVDKEELENDDDLSEDDNNYIETIVRETDG